MARKAAGPLTLYDFTTVEEVLIGWQTHALRQTTLHAESGRRLACAHWWIGVVAAVITGIAGTLVTVGVQTSVGWWGLGAGFLAAVATILVSVQTFPRPRGPGRTPPAGGHGL